MYVMFYCINFIHIYKHLLILNFMPATRFKQTRTEAKKKQKKKKNDQGSCGMLQQHLLGTHVHSCIGNRL